MNYFKRFIFLLYLKIQHPNLFHTMKNLRILLSTRLSLLWDLSKLFMSKVLRKRSFLKPEKELTHLLIKKNNNYPFDRNTIE